MRNKTLEDQLALIDTTSTWALWRTVEPRVLARRSPVLSEVHLRLDLAMDAICRIHPDLAGIAEDLIDGHPKGLPKLLAALPADPAEETARFDMRMTVVLYSWAKGEQVGVKPGGFNPFAPNMLARGLMRFADTLPPPEPVRSSKPRHLLSGDEHQAVTEWKRERRRLISMARDWIRMDALARVFEDIPERDERRLFSCARVICEAASDLSEGIAVRDRFEEAEGDDLFRVPDPYMDLDEPEEADHRVASMTVLSTYVRRNELERQGWDRLAAPLPLRGNKPHEVVRGLRQEFPWMQDAIEHIRRDLSLGRLRKDSSSAIRIRPLLLLGDPGTGKSRFARRFAELAGLPVRTIGCGGICDNRDLSGTSKGYATGEASAVLRAIRDGGAANPVILVDEVEKAGLSRHNGRIVDTLLAMLEPETARSWYDEYLCTASDLSAVNWILSANSLAGLPDPLLNRMTVVRVTSPSSEQLPAILENLKTEIAKELRVDPFALPEIHPEAERMLEHAFAEGQSIRRIRAALLAAIGASVDGPRILH